MQAPAVRVAVAAAAQLNSDLPAAVVLALLRHSDRSFRAAACQCARTLSEAIPILIDLLNDLDREVSGSAACALGHLGRPEARPALIRLLGTAPSPEVIDAMATVADEGCVVLLARIARTKPGIARAARDALDRIDHPRAAQLLAALTPSQGQDSDDVTADG